MNCENCRWYKTTYCTYNNSVWAIAARCLLGGCDGSLYKPSETAICTKWEDGTPTAVYEEEKINYEPKYIDANKVIDYANQEITAAFYYPQGAQEQRKRDEQAYRDKWAFVKQIMVGTPAADVMEVRHGRWLHLHLEPDDITGNTKGECSICGKSRIVDNYCPNCGSRMDLEADEDD